MTFNCDKSMATEASVTVRLRKIGINDHDSLSPSGKCSGKCDCSCRLANAAFLIGYRDGCHMLIPFIEIWISINRYPFTSIDKQTRRMVGQDELEMFSDYCIIDSELCNVETRKNDDQMQKLLETFLYQLYL